MYPRTRIALIVLSLCSSISPTLAAESSKSWPSSADYTEPYQQEALQIHQDTVAMRTALGHGKVPEMAEYLADKFRKAGFASTDVKVIPFEVPGGEVTASLVVRYPGDGSLEKKPVLLMAHMDIVDALPEDWERDPFTLIEEDGYLFGRGSVDDKIGTTLITSAFLRLKREGFVPGRDFIIAFTGDEETGMLNVRVLANQFRSLVDAEFALNADGGGGILSEDGMPLSYTVQTAEKTYASFTFTIRNPGGHSSLPRKDNAIYELADLLKNIQELEFPVRHNATTLRAFELMAETTPDPAGDMMARFAKNPEDAEAAAALSEDPGMVGNLRTTCVATMLNGGHAENALPQSASATVNCRIFPGVEVDAVKQALVEAIDNESVEVEVLGDPRAGPASPLLDEVFGAITRTVHVQYPGLPVVPVQVPYATDGRETRLAGIPTYGTLGIFLWPGEMFAHGLNERVRVKSFYDGLEHWYLLLKDLGAQPETQSD